MLKMTNAVHYIYDSTSEQFSERYDLIKDKFFSLIGVPAHWTDTKNF